MTIKSISVKKLNQRLSGKINFYSDLNILTGVNGSGKTTLLKACWYLISGNFEKTFQEIDFEEIEVETSKARVLLKCINATAEDAEYEISILHIDMPGFDVDKFLDHPTRTLRGKWDDIKSLLWRFGMVVALAHKSLFFPTFRRVEGGFSVGATGKGLREMRNPFGPTEDDELTKSLRVISEKLTEFENMFICSVSTTDVETLISETSATMTAAQKEKYEALAQRISSKIRQWQGSGSSTSDSAEKLTQILKDVTDTEEKRNQITEPIQLLDAELSQFFHGRRVSIGKTKFGTGPLEIAARALSAGEKQLISFLCYATLYKNCIFMIDEPELSLHLDWQRKLVGSLKSLGPSNQYFFVTHSPAIYTKFADKEIRVDKLFPLPE